VTRVTVAFGAPAQFLATTKISSPTTEPIVNVMNHVDEHASPADPKMRELSPAELDVVAGAGKRTEVKDAHDKYANIEVSYGLQASYTEPVYDLTGAARWR
jgi:hypothetical protein